MRPQLTVSDAVPEHGAAPPEHREGSSAGGEGATLGRISRVAALDGTVGAGVVFAGALALFAVQSLAVALVLGRDAEDYVIHGWELFRHDPLFPKLMLARTPVSGLVIDGLYAAGGSVGLEIGLGLLFAGAVMGWVAVARQWGRKPAIAMFVLLAVVPAFGLFFHRVSSDPVFAAILPLVAYTAIRLGRRPTVPGALALGVSVALLILTRPSGQPFLLLALLPLGVTLPWRKRVGLSLSVTAAALALVAGWAVANHVRYGELTVAHGGRSGVPLYRVFVIDPKVSRDNGQASLAVATAVERRLLSLEPYHSLGFDVDEILAAQSVWALDDVVHATEAEYGATVGAETLFRAGMEGVRADVGAYVRGVGLGLTGFLLLPYSPGYSIAGYTQADSGSADAVLGQPGRGRRIPGDVDGQSSVWAQAMIKSWGLEATDRYRIVGGLRPLADAIWPSLERRALVWSDPADAARYADVRERLRGFVEDASNGDRHAGAAQALRVGSLVLPPSGFWILVALAFALRFRPRGLWSPTLLAAASLLVLFHTALAFPRILTTCCRSCRRSCSSRLQRWPVAVRARRSAGRRIPRQGRHELRCHRGQRRDAHSSVARQSSRAVTARIAEACVVVAVLAGFVGYRRAHPERPVARGAPVPPDADCLDGPGVPRGWLRPPAPEAPCLRRAVRGAVRVPAVPGARRAADGARPGRGRGAPAHQPPLLRPHRLAALGPRPVRGRPGQRRRRSRRVRVHAPRAPLEPHLDDRVPRDRRRGRFRVRPRALARPRAPGVLALALAAGLVGMLVKPTTAVFWTSRRSSTDRGGGVPRRGRAASDSRLPSRSGCRSSQRRSGRDTPTRSRQRALSRSGSPGGTSAAGTSAGSTTGSSGISGR